MKGPGSGRGGAAGASVGVGVRGAATAAEHWGQAWGAVGRGEVGPPQTGRGAARRHCDRGIGRHDGLPLPKFGAPPAHPRGRHTEHRGPGPWHMVTQLSGNGGFWAGHRRRTPPEREREGPGARGRRAQCRRPVITGGGVHGRAGAEAKEGAEGGVRGGGQAGACRKGGGGVGGGGVVPPSPHSRIETNGFHAPPKPQARL